jgi:hypothetical protein
MMSPPTTSPSADAAIWARSIKQFELLSNVGLWNRVRAVGYDDQTGLVRPDDR